MNESERLVAKRHFVEFNIRYYEVKLRIQQSRIKRKALETFATGPPSKGQL